MLPVKLPVVFEFAVHRTDDGIFLGGHSPDVSVEETHIDRAVVYSRHGVVETGVLGALCLIIERFAVYFFAVKDKGFFAGVFDSGVLVGFDLFADEITDVFVPQIVAVESFFGGEICLIGRAAEKHGVVVSGIGFLFDIADVKDVELVEIDASGGIKHLFVVIKIGKRILSDLAQVVGAGGTCAPFPGRLQCGQQYGGKDGDYRNNHQQFNQRER